MFFLRTRHALMILCLLAVFLPAQSAAAQEVYPVYTVQPGDSLGGLSALFHTTVNQLIRSNHIADPDVLTPGTKLNIPSLPGISGEIMLHPLSAGETLHILARQLSLPEAELQRFNFLTQPESLPLGSNVIVVNAGRGERVQLPVTSGVTHLELAAAAGINPWIASEANGLKGRWDLVQNDTLFLPSSAEVSAAGQLPGVTDLQFSSLPFQQGKTFVLNATLGAGATLTGQINGHQLEFYTGDQAQSVAYGGIERMLPPGIYPLVLTSTSAMGKSFSLLQNVKVAAVNYGVNTPFQVADQLVDPAVTGPETDRVNAIVAPITPVKYWNGDGFTSPTPQPDCITSTFGSLRSYNGSDFIYFHAGMDFCGNDTTQIFAAADGVVVFAGTLTVRGNATIIDHGQGLYTGYWHQSKQLVQAGDHVRAGQVIGMVGATGRVTGPHLHFEVFVNGVQVDPTDWLRSQIP